MHATLTKGHHTKENRTKGSLRTSRHANYVRSASPVVRREVFLFAIIERKDLAELTNFTVTPRAGLKPMQPMQLHWAPRLLVWVDYSFLPDTPCA